MPDGRPDREYLGGVSAEPALVTMEEALATVDVVDGQRMVEGVPVPDFVMGDADTARWANAQRWAAHSLQLPPSSGPVWQLTRTIFSDRESYPS
jgi:hypothetical protein